MKTYNQPLHPNWKGGPEIFQKHYEPVMASIWGRLSSSNQRPVFYGDFENRRCAMCGKETPEVTFKLISHLVSASVGNRTFRSNEECDICNKAYQHHEDELAKWLLPHRVMGQVRKRKGHPEILTGQDGSVKWNEQEQQLIITTEGSKFEDIVKITGGNTAQLAMDAPSFLPFSGIKSLLRSVWLALDPEQRTKLSYIKKLINGEIITNNIEWLEVSLPDKLDAFILECWSKRESSKIVSSPFIIRFIMAYYSIIWCCPDWLTNEYVPSLLPPFDEAIDVKRLQCEFFSSADPAERIGRPNFYFTITYDKIIDAEEERN